MFYNIFIYLELKTPNKPPTTNSRPPGYVAPVNEVSISTVVELVNISQKPLMDFKKDIIRAAIEAANPDYKGERNEKDTKEIFDNLVSRYVTKNEVFSPLFQ